jgi:cold shock CspA family protein
MGRSQESYNKKEVRTKKEKKRKDKEQKRMERKSGEKSGSLDDMIAYVDAYGNITDSPPESPAEEIDVEAIAVSVPKKEDMDEVSNLRSGKVDFFEGSKGFGFIHDMQSGDRIFVHISEVEGDIAEGMLVSYTLGRGPKGPVAMGVTKLK